MASFGDNKVPPSHNPINPQFEEIESQYQAQRSIRSQKIEDKIEEIEEFLLKSSHDPKDLEDTFSLLTDLRNLLFYSFLRADEEDQLASELTELKDQLDGGVMRVTSTFEYLSKLMLRLEENIPKIKVLNLLQKFKNHLHYFPKLGLPSVEEKEYDEMVSPIHTFLKNDLTKFQIETIAKRLNNIFLVFKENPRANLSITLETIKQLCKEILSGSI